MADRQTGLALLYLLGLLGGVHLHGAQLAVQRLALVEKGLRQLGGVRVDPAVQETPLVHGLRRDRTRGRGTLHGRPGWRRRRGAGRPGKTGCPRAAWTGTSHHVRPKPGRHGGAGAAESRFEPESRRSWRPRRSPLMKRRAGAGGATDAVVH